jgi:hypothetical protein
MSNDPVFVVVFDPVRNLVSTRFTGAVTGAALQTAAAQVEAQLPQLKPGFRVFADFGQVAAMDLDCMIPLTRIMDLYRERAVGLVVRILPPKERDIGINLLSVVHYRGKVKTVTVDTAADAERVLR